MLRVTLVKVGKFRPTVNAISKYTRWRYSEASYVVREHMPCVIAQYRESDVEKELKLNTLIAELTEAGADFKVEFLPA